MRCVCARVRVCVRAWVSRACVCAFARGCGTILRHKFQKKEANYVLSLF